MCLLSPLDISSLDTSLGYLAYNWSKSHQEKRCRLHQEPQQAHRKVDQEAPNVVVATAPVAIPMKTVPSFWEGVVDQSLLSQFPNRSNQRVDHEAKGALAATATYPKTEPYSWDEISLAQTPLSHFVVVLSRSMYPRLEGTLRLGLPWEN